MQCFKWLHAKTNGLPHDDDDLAGLFTQSQIQHTYMYSLNSVQQICIHMWVVFTQSRNYGFVFHIFIPIFGFGNALFYGWEEVAGSGFKQSSH